MFFAVIDIFKGADILIYPLGLCSVLMVYIICERSYALRKAAIMPDDLVEAIVTGKPITGGRHTVLARVLRSTTCSAASLIWTSSTPQPP
jgi:biopolymer transport protein ExbB